jgi:hypothetical protein
MLRNPSGVFFCFGKPRSLKYNSLTDEPWPFQRSSTTNAPDLAQPQVAAGGVVLAQLLRRVGVAGVFVDEATS